ncbi:MAG: PEP-CTERM sorting domain-containing protein [Burkholderiales bacterium]|jgi:hypothetical protein|nr:MAG: PEP-CTERM sorting domain-containing protein [Burkholderiales bacterium]
MRFISRFALSVITLSIGLLAQSAQAVSLTAPVSPNPFADTALGGTTAAARPELAGTVLQDVISPFSFSGVSGSVQNRVVRETGTGTLDFYWKVNVDASTNGTGVSAFRLADFGYNNLKDADFRTDGLGTTGPDTARLFNVANYPAGDINFLFNGTGGVAPGSESRFFFLHTTATSYDKIASYDLLTTGAQKLSGSFQTFAPAVPEPSTYALMGAGMLMMGALLRGRRRGQ